MRFSIRVVCVLGIVGSPSIAHAQHMERVSIATNGTQADADSHHATVSADGRCIAFTGYAGNLIVGMPDALGHPDIFLRNRATGTTELISVSSTGGLADGGSQGAALSSNGRYVAFDSDAKNLINPAELTATGDVFLRDRQTATTVRITHAVGSSSGASISASGRFVAFQSNDDSLGAPFSNGFIDVYVYDAVAHMITTVTAGNGNSFGASISPDGRYVAFVSDATNLTLNPTGGFRQVYVRDLQSATIELVSQSTLGAIGSGNSQGLWKPAISSDGQFVVFESDAINLVPADANGVRDVFLRDRTSGTTTCVSMSTTGQQGDGASYDPTISEDGRFVAFRSEASNFIVGDVMLAFTDDLDVFVHDRLTHTTEPVSLSGSGVLGNALSSVSSISTTGRYIVFESAASNLAAGDTNAVRDIFIRDRDRWPECGIFPIRKQ